MRLLPIALLCAAVLAPPATATAAAPLPRVTVDPGETIGDKDIPARMTLPGFDGTVAIELRGQSSRKFAKKSYAVELRDAEGKNLDAPLLGMPADDDWILYAAYSDRTLMRNVLAYETARRLGGYAARTRFVELVVNGRPDGAYVLMEKPKLQKHRVQGSDDAFMLELTSRRQAGRKDPSFQTPVTRRPIVWEDPERKALSGAKARAIARQVGAAERALYRGRPGAWRKHLHRRSTVDFLLLHELYKNHDGMHSSTFLTGEPGGRLRLGPIWDFDMSMGMGRFVPMRGPAGWMLHNRPWAEPLYDNRAFARSMARRWSQLRASGLREWLMKRVGAHHALLVDAAESDSARWPAEGVRPAGTHDGSVAELERWLDRRIAWLDRNLPRLGR